MSNRKKAQDPPRYLMLVVDGEESEMVDVTLKQARALADEMKRDGVTPNYINGGLRFFPMGNEDEYIDIIDVRSLEDSWRYAGKRPGPRRVMETWNPNALEELQEAQARRAEG